MTLPKRQFNDKTLFIAYISIPAVVLCAKKCYTKDVKNMMFRAGLAAGVLLAGHEAPALAEPRAAMCVEVYDETGKGISPALSEQIGSFAMNGIEVHVQILADAEAEGVLDEDEADAYAKRLEQLCDWPDDNRLNILMAYDHGVSAREDDDAVIMNINEVGRTDEIISEGRKNRALDNLEAKYIDRNGYLIPSDDYQSDMAELLADIDPYSDEANIDRSPIEIPSIPLKPILAVSGLSALLGAGAGRILHGRRLKQLHGRTITESERAGGELLASQQNAQPQLSILHEDDAAQLRGRVDAVDQLLVDLMESRSGFDEKYQTERRRWWWPRIKPIQQASDKAAEITRGGMNTAEAIRIEVGYIEGLRSDINSLFAKFQSRLDLLDNVTSSLREDGWELGRYDEEIADLQDAETELAQRIADRYLEEPARILAEKSTLADNLLQTIEDLPGRYEEVQEDIASLGPKNDTEDLPNRYEEVREDIASLGPKNETLDQEQLGAREQLDLLRQAYDLSCYEDLSGADARMQELSDRLQSLSQDAGRFVGIKAADTVEQAEQHLDLISEEQQLLKNLINSIHGRADKLQRIKDKLPDNLKVGFFQTQALMEVCASADVSQVTRGDAQELKESLDRVNSHLMNEARPRYLEIDKQLASTRAQIDKLKDKAARERQAAEAARYVPPPVSAPRRPGGGYSGTGSRTGGSSPSRSTSRRMGGSSGTGSSTTRRIGGGSSRPSRGSSTTRRMGGRRK